MTRNRATAASRARWSPWSSGATNAEHVLGQQAIPLYEQTPANGERALRPDHPNLSPPAATSRTPAGGAGRLLNHTACHLTKPADHQAHPRASIIQARRPWEVA